MTITVTFLNDSGNKPIIYMDRPDLNQFTLTITTDSATPVAITEVNIRFPLKIFTPDNVKDITVTSDGWNAPRAARSNLRLTPTGSFNLSSGTPLIIKLGGAKSGFNAATNDEVLVHAGGEAPTTKLFLMRYPTEAGDLTSALKPKLLPERVFRTPTGHGTLENVIRLVLTNLSPSTPLVQAAWVRTPTVLLSFVYGSDIGSLTVARPSSDPNSAFNIVVDVQATYKDSKQTFEWSSAPPDPGATDVSPTWSLQPVLENVQVLGPASGANVEFRISGLSTAAPAGFTQVYLQYSDFPGYSDGYFTLQLHKEEPQPTIIFFDGDPSRVAALNDKVTVKWQTFSVDKVELQFGDKTLSSVNGDINIERGTYTQAIDRTTQFSLLAYDDVADAQPQHTLQWTARVPDARITTFKSDVTSAIAGSPVTLNWATAYARAGELRSSIDATYFIRDKDLVKGSKPYYPSRSVTYTLHLDGEGDPPDQRIPVFVLAHDWSSRRMGLDPDAIQLPVMFALDSGLILVGGQSANAIFGSPDGQSWSQVGTAGFPARNAAAGCAHSNKLWIMGGLCSGQPSNDVWSSSDGLTWTSATVAAGWPKRARFACASFKDKLWVMGGLDQNLQPLNDIWSSADGITWTKAPGTPKWSARSGLALARHDGKLWLFGGLLASGEASAELWVSDDGVNWTEVSSDDGFGGGVAARQQAVMASVGGALYMGGGIDGAGKPSGDFYKFADNSWDLTTVPSAMSAQSQNAFTVWRDALWIAGGLNGTAANDVVWSYFPAHVG